MSPLIAIRVYYREGRFDNMFESRRAKELAAPASHAHQSACHVCRPKLLQDSPTRTMFAVIFKILNQPCGRVEAIRVNVLSTTRAAEVTKDGVHLIKNNVIRFLNLVRNNTIVVDAIWPPFVIMLHFHLFL